MTRRNRFHNSLSPPINIMVNTMHNMYLLHEAFELIIIQYVHMSWASMFNEATFREIRKSTSPNDGRSISRNVASLNIIVHDLINLLTIIYTEQISENIFTYFELLFWVFMFVVSLGVAIIVCLLFIYSIQKNMNNRIAAV